MRKSATALGLFLIMICISASGQSMSDQRLVIDGIGSPAGAGSAEPNLHVSADGRAHLSWIEPAAEKHRAKTGLPSQLVEGRGQEGGLAPAVEVGPNLVASHNSGGKPTFLTPTLPMLTVNLQSCLQGLLLVPPNRLHPRTAGASPPS